MNEDRSKTESCTRTKYSYDPVGNRTASLGVSSYTTNSSNEMTANSNASYTYDLNGNTLTKVVGSNTTSYAWDYENRLTSVTLPNSGGTVTFKYDPFGRRIEKVSPTATSIFLYDGDNLVQTVNSSGTVVAHYTQTQNIDEPLAMQRGTAVDYYEADGLGSVTSLTASNGTIAQSYTYDSFGNLSNSSGSLTNYFRYTGREFDTETNLYYYRARYYDPGTGRFLTEDRAGFKSGIDFYPYVRNNPIGLRDWDGNAPDGGPVVVVWKWGVGFANWIKCSITASYCLTGLPDGIKALNRSLDGNFNGQPSDTFDNLVNQQHATGKSSASNLRLNQYCAGDQDCMQAFESCLQAGQTNPLPTPPLPTVTQQSPPPGGWRR
jgi:RHS repeat-associated protein